jgi:ParB family chromosome partitioning protein
VDQPATGASPTSATPPQAETASLGEVEEILSEQLATRVTIQMAKKRGRIIIEFGSADDLERIVSEIVGSGHGLAPAD